MVLQLPWTVRPDGLSVHDNVRPLMLFRLNPSMFVHVLTLWSLRIPGTNYINRINLKVTSLFMKNVR